MRTAKRRRWKHILVQNGYPFRDYFEEGEHYGGVYFVKGGRLIKIGWSVYPPEQRMSSLQIGSPVPLTILGYIPNSSRRLERDLHHEFSRQRVHGEWFKPTDRLLEIISGWSVLAI